MAALEVIALTLAAGAAIPLGGVVARWEHLGKGNVHDDMVHAVSGFGGGALLAAVAFVLLPDGIEHVGPWTAIVSFLIGAAGILAVRHALGHGEITAMLSDFFPESIALGAALATGTSAAYLLALIVGVQNLAEGFSSYREACRGRPKDIGRKVLWFLVGAALIGPLAGLVGIALADVRYAVGAITLAAAGAIVALVFQDIAPASHRKGHVVPTLGAVLGFTMGFAGHLWMA